MIYGIDIYAPPALDKIRYHLSQSVDFVTEFGRVSKARRETADQMEKMVLCHMLIDWVNGLVPGVNCKGALREIKGSSELVGTEQEAREGKLRFRLLLGSKEAATKVRLFLPSELYIQQGAVFLPNYSYTLPDEEAA